MIDLFRTSAPMTGGIRMPPTWPFIQRNFKANIDKVKQYYQTNPLMLRNNHTLVRLVDSMPSSLALSLLVYYKDVDRQALRHAQSQNFTTVYSTGYVRTGGFFGLSNSEIYLAVDDYFDVEELERNWRNAASVKVLQHDFDSLQMAMPTPEYYWSDSSSLATLVVNVPMIMAQYWCFCKENKLRPAGEQWSTQQFVAAYVLPNMLPSMLERALFNRLKCLSGQNPSPKSGVLKRPHPFSFVDYTPAIDTALDMVLDNIRVSTKSFDTVLKSIPSLTQMHMYEAILMPDIAPTRQIDWALTATRLADVEWLFNIVEPELLKKNQMVVNQFFTDLRRNHDYALMQTQLPQRQAALVKACVQRLLKMANRDYL